MLAVANTKALWYLTRATGLVSLLLLTGSVVLGIMGAQRWTSPRWPRFVTAGLHKNLSLLAVAFVAVHVVTAVTDTFVTITWVNAFVPFTGTYRPLWLGLGAVAGDLLIALIVTSLARPWIGYRVWRAVHWAAYACWPIALVHGLGTGTDAGRGWALAVFIGCLAAVAGATWWRLDRLGDRVDARAKAGAVAASIAVPVGILAWSAAGPLQSGWAARAGTPPPAGSVAALASSAPGAFASPFTATLAGSAGQSPPDANGNATITLAAALDGPVRGVLQVTLNGPVLPAGGVQMTSGHATLGPTDRPTLFSGPVTALSGDRLTLQLDATTTQIYARVNVVIDASQHLSGTIRTSVNRPA